MAAIIVVVTIAVLGLRFYWMSEGREDLAQELKEADRIEAKETRDEVEDAIRDSRKLPVFERLCRNGQLRAGCPR